MLIPWKDLPVETLDNVIEHYLTSQLDDLNVETFNLSKQKEFILSQIKINEILIEWSEIHESITLIRKEQYSLRSQEID